MDSPVILGILNYQLASANFQVPKTDVLILSNKRNALFALGCWNPVVCIPCFWNYWARDIVGECLCSLQAESYNYRELCLFLYSLFHIPDMKLFGVCAVLSAETWESSVSVFYRGLMRLYFKISLLFCLLGLWVTWKCHSLIIWAKLSA